MNLECCCKQFQENIFHSTNNVVRTAGYSNKKKEREGAGGDKAIELRNKIVWEARVRDATQTTVGVRDARPQQDRTQTNSSAKRPPI